MPLSAFDHSVDFTVGGRVFKTYYKVLGNLKAGQCPVVMLHGGPGMNHIYMTPHDLLFTDASIPVVYYNQISYRDFPNSPAEFWSMELFKDELDNLLNHLGIRGNFVLLGHSWGGTIASDYAVTRMHQGLKGLIVANTFCSAKLYREGVAFWIDALPNGLPEIIKKHKANGTTDAEEYTKAMQLYNNLHICTLDPWPQPLVASLDFSKGNRHPDFNMSKILKDWDVTNGLHKITCPTLLISSPVDEMWEPCVKPFFEGIPLCKWVEFQNSSHLPMYEEPQRYLQIVVDFFNVALQR
ncbi:Alpha/Beta hydrolase protein [Lentinula edodes]|uniref:Alpha/Beta hydrolase protein n=1 Tax=Lentinula edodes TaxID=5353 RepID=UPI001E8D5179|nr:Alpha/Beta hydrolase protein [Lentinula edodes]KAH7869187.1 Alpha/Beta hydrolase protein [Lentinula edodes]